MEIHTHTLQNGLRIVCHHNPITAMAAVNILYDVGARDESPEQTGMAHLLEHLMFSGSRNVPDFDAEMERAGASTNAWTSNDFTNFYCTVPAGNIEVAFRAESDRMMGPDITERALATQKDVVTEEFRQTTLTPPYGDLMSVFRGLAYKVHPYRWSVIGLTPRHIADATLGSVRSFFRTHYGPDTAVLSVAGPTPPDRIFALAEKWFGDIPPVSRPRRVLPQEPEQTAPVTETVYRDIPVGHIITGYHIGGYLSRESKGADFLTDILAQGHSSRSYRRMILGSDLFADFDTSITASEDPGLLMVSARLSGNAPGVVDAALRKIDTFIAEILSEGISANELQRVRNQFDSKLVFSNVSNPAIASNNALNLFHGETRESLVRQYGSFTAPELEDLAHKILTENNKTTLLYLPR